MINTLKPLPAESLSWQCDPASFDFETTATVGDLAEVVGQPRATKAVRFGVEMRQPGYNLFVLGPAGIGKRTLVEQCIGEASRKSATPPDWCYVNDFEHPRCPLALSVPAGRGLEIRNDVRMLTKDLANAIPAVLDSDEHRTRVQAVEREAIDRQRQSLEQLGDKAEHQDVQLIRTPGGFALAPLRAGQVLSPEEFDKLSGDEQKQIEQKISVLQDELQALIEQFPRLLKEARDKIKQLHCE